MSSYYRVKKDTPLWEKGAILKLESGSGYLPTEDLWNTEANDTGTEYLSTPIVEKNPEWFERVYEASNFGKVKYLTKEQAKKIASRFYAGKGKDETDEN